MSVPFSEHKFDSKMAWRLYNLAMKGAEDESLVYECDTLDCWYVDNDLRSEVDVSELDATTTVVGIRYHNSGSVSLVELTDKGYDEVQEETMLLPDDFEAGIS